MPRKKHEKQHPFADNVIRNMGKVQVTLNCYHDYRDALQIAYETAVQARTHRHYMNVPGEDASKHRHEWHWNMKALRNTINRAREKKAHFIAHLYGTTDDTPIDPSVYFNIGAIRLRYPYTEKEET